MKTFIEQEVIERLLENRRRIRMMPTGTEEYRKLANEIKKDTATLQSIRHTFYGPVDNGSDIVPPNPLEGFQKRVHETLTVEGMFPLIGLMYFFLLFATGDYAKIPAGAMFCAVPLGILAFLQLYNRWK